MTVSILELLAAAAAGFVLGAALWRALTLRDRRETEQRHHSEVADLTDRWQQAKAALDALETDRASKTSGLRAKPEQAALRAPRVEPATPPVDPPAPAEAATEAPPAPSPAQAEPDDLKRIKGVGKALEHKLHELGVSSYRQIATWTDADIQRIEAGLQSIPGRIRRDRWVEQARKLA
ncbi:MAG: hypothetical protein GC160_05515 [Acidobacteria bacterium]|nr:hypothetical protein [Acidobacteriota bacterium]